MTRDERIAAACAGYVSGDPPRRHRDGIALALDAALADVGGLDGLDGLSALRADRGWLREALRVIAVQALAESESASLDEAGDPLASWPPRWRAAVRESEADDE